MSLLNLSLFNCNLALPFNPQAALLLGLVPAGVGFNRLLPKAALSGSGAPSRTRWYLSSGQWRADARTLTAAAEFVFGPDPVPAPAANLAVRDRPRETAQSPVNASLESRRDAW